MVCGWLLAVATPALLKSSCAVPPVFGHEKTARRGAQGGWWGVVLLPGLEPGSTPQLVWRRCLGAVLDERR